MNDLAQRAREKQGGTPEIKEVLASQARPAQTFDCRCRLTTPWAEGRRQPNQTGPAFRACPSPSSLVNLSMTMDACGWEQEVENVVEQKRVWGNAKGEFNIANRIEFSSTILFRIGQVMDD